MAKIKRSSSVKVALMGAAAFSLAACQDDRIEAQSFPNEDACVQASFNPGSDFTAEDCEKTFDLAEKEHERTAPRYAEAKLCEEQHGGECQMVQAPAASGGGGGFFMPMMMGYLIGNMMSGNNSHNSYRAQPLYKTSSGKFATADGKTTMGSLRSTTKISPKSFNAIKTASAKPMTRASVKSSGGFGASRTSSGKPNFGG